MNDDIDEYWENGETREAIIYGMDLTYPIVNIPHVEESIEIVHNNSKVIGNS